jgi:peptidoglycan/xylan/chitin deacetylase (PgdA/CDA1 family)
VEQLAAGEVQAETETVALVDTQKPEETETQQTQEEDYSNVVTGIDSPENMAEEGDTHQVYLTFDGSPSTNTDSILDVLDEYGVKATFFVVGDESDDAEAIYKRIAEDGQTLGMHSYSNKYSTIYASTDAFTEDLDRLSSYLEKVTGIKSVYYRFPGGSSNEISNVSMAAFVHILNEKGITFFDWNVSAGDTASNYSADDIVTNVTEGISHYKTSVVLLHDGEDKSTTVEALGPLIEALQSMDAQILPIDENTDVIQYIKADSVG